VQPRFAEPSAAMINEGPSFGYHAIVVLLGFSKNTLQRLF